MKNVLIGLVVGIAVIAAFSFGLQSGDEPDRPIEELGEGLDDATDDLKDAAEEAADAAEDAAN